jgi:hypothetical protein
VTVRAKNPRIPCPRSSSLFLLQSNISPKSFNVHNMGTATITFSTVHGLLHISLHALPLALYSICRRRSYPILLPSDHTFPPMTECEYDSLSSSYFSMNSPMPCCLGITSCHLCPSLGFLSPNTSPSRFPMRRWSLKVVCQKNQ